VAKLKELMSLENFVPLFLVSGAFAVYESFEDSVKGGYKKLRAALTKAFATDSLSAYGEFTQRRLREGEAVDVFLADLRRLAELVSGGKDSKWIKCAFVTGLPDSVRRQLVMSCAVDGMDLPEMVEKVRSVLNSSRAEVSAVAVNFAKSRDAPSRAMKCFSCNREGHFARECPDRKMPARTCFRCGEHGHTSPMCKKEGREVWRHPVERRLEELHETNGKERWQKN
jgi:hypothetical protein